MTGEPPNRQYRPPPSIRAQFDRLTALAADLGLTVRTRPTQPYGWQLLNADVEVAAGSLDHLEEVLTRMSERPENVADDPFGGRQPTSHERMTGLPWDASYHDGPAPWDIGHPQGAVVRLAAAGGFAGAVLDVGCGSGENALHIAALGLPVLGVDVAETALAIARAQAEERGIDVEFATADAFELARVGRKFQTVLDSGMFHTLSSDERPKYVASLASVTEHEGTLYVLCFSDIGADTGPHPVSRGDLTAAFTPAAGWAIAAIEPDRVETGYHENGAPAWLATMKRA